MDWFSPQVGVVAAALLAVRVRRQAVAEDTEAAAGEQGGAGRSLLARRGSVVAGLEAVAAHANYGALDIDAPCTARVVEEMMYERDSEGSWFRDV